MFSEIAKKLALSSPSKSRKSHTPSVAPVLPAESVVSHESALNASPSSNFVILRALYNYRDENYIVKKVNGEGYSFFPSFNKGDLVMVIRREELKNMNSWLTLSYTRNHKVPANYFEVTAENPVHVLMKTLNTQILNNLRGGLKQLREIFETSLSGKKSDVAWCESIAHGYWPKQYTKEIKDTLTIIQDILPAKIISAFGCMRCEKRNVPVRGCHLIAEESDEIDGHEDGNRVFDIIQYGGLNLCEFCYKALNTEKKGLKFYVKIQPEDVETVLRRFRTNDFKSVNVTPKSLNVSPSNQLGLDLDTKRPEPETIQEGPEPITKEEKNQIKELSKEDQDDKLAMQLIEDLKNSDTDNQTNMDQIMKYKKYIEQSSSKKDKNKYSVELKIYSNRYDQNLKESLNKLDYFLLCFTEEEIFQKNKLKDMHLLGSLSLFQFLLNNDIDTVRIYLREEVEFYSGRERRINHLFNFHMCTEFINNPAWIYSSLIGAPVSSYMRSLSLSNHKCARKEADISVAVIALISVYFTALKLSKADKKLIVKAFERSLLLANKNLNFYVVWFNVDDVLSFSYSNTQSYSSRVLKLIESRSNSIKSNLITDCITEKKPIHQIIDLLREVDSGLEKTFKLTNYNGDIIKDNDEELIYEEPIQIQSVVTTKCGVCQDKHFSDECPILIEFQNGLKLINISRLDVENPTLVIVSSLKALSVLIDNLGEKTPQEGLNFPVNEVFKNIYMKLKNILSSRLRRVNIGALIGLNTEIKEFIRKEETEFEDEINTYESIMNHGFVTFTSDLSIKIFPFIKQNRGGVTHYFMGNYDQIGWPGTYDRSPMKFKAVQSLIYSLKSHNIGYKKLEKIWTKFKANHRYSPRLNSLINQTYDMDYDRTVELRYDLSFSPEPSVIRAYYYSGLLFQYKPSFRTVWPDVDFWFDLKVDDFIKDVVELKPKDWYLCGLIDSNTPLVHSFMHDVAKNHLEQIEKLGKIGSDTDVDLIIKEFVDTDMEILIQIFIEGYQFVGKRGRFYDVSHKEFIFFNGDDFKRFQEVLGFSEKVRYQGDELHTNCENLVYKLLNHFIYSNLEMFEAQSECDFKLSIDLVESSIEDWLESDYKKNIGSKTDKDQKNEAALIERTKEEEDFLKSLLDTMDSDQSDSENESGAASGTEIQEPLPTVELSVDKEQDTSVNNSQQVSPGPSSVSTEQNDDDRSSGEDGYKDQMNEDKLFNVDDDAVEELREGLELIKDLDDDEEDDLIQSFFIFESYVMSYFECCIDFSYVKREQKKETKIDVFNSSDLMYSHIKQILGERENLLKRILNKFPIDHLTFEEIAPEDYDWKLETGKGFIPNMADLSDDDSSFGHSDFGEESDDLPEENEEDTQNASEVESEETPHDPEENDVETGDEQRSSQSIVQSGSGETQLPESHADQLDDDHSMRKEETKIDDEITRHDSPQLDQDSGKSADTSPPVHPLDQRLTRFIFDQIVLGEMRKLRQTRLISYDLEVEDEVFDLGKRDHVVMKKVIYTITGNGLKPVISNKKERQSCLTKVVREMGYFVSADINKVCDADIRLRRDLAFENRQVFILLDNENSHISLNEFEGSRKTVFSEVYMLKQNLYSSEEELEEESRLDEDSPLGQFRYKSKMMKLVYNEPELIWTDRNSFIIQLLRFFESDVNLFYSFQNYLGVTVVTAMKFFIEQFLFIFDKVSMMQDRPKMFIKLFIEDFKPNYRFNGSSDLTEFCTCVHTFLVGLDFSEAWGEDIDLDDLKLIRDRVEILTRNIRINSTINKITGYLPTLTATKFVYSEDLISTFRERNLDLLTSLNESKVEDVPVSKRILLDTNIFLNHPKIYKKKFNFLFIIPQVIINELHRLFLNDQYNILDLFVFMSNNEFYADLNLNMSTGDMLIEEYKDFCTIITADNELREKVNGVRTDRHFHKWILESPDVYEEKKLISLSYFRIFGLSEFFLKEKKLFCSHYQSHYSHFFVNDNDPSQILLPDLKQSNKLEKTDIDQFDLNLTPNKRLILLEDEEDKLEANIEQNILDSIDIVNNINIKQTGFVSTRKEKLNDKKKLVLDEIETKYKIQKDSGVLRSNEEKMNSERINVKDSDNDRDSVFPVHDLSFIISKEKKGSDFHLSKFVFADSERPFFSQLDQEHTHNYNKIKNFDAFKMRYKNEIKKSASFKYFYDDNWDFPEFEFAHEKIKIELKGSSNIVKALSDKTDEERKVLEFSELRRFSDLHIHMIEHLMNYKPKFGDKDIIITSNGFLNIGIIYSRNLAARNYNAKVGFRYFFLTKNPTHELFYPEFVSNKNENYNAYMCISRFYYISINTVINRSRLYLNTFLMRYKTVSVQDFMIVYWSNFFSSSNTKKLLSFFKYFNIIAHSDFSKIKNLEKKYLAICPKRKIELCLLKLVCRIEENMIGGSFDSLLGKPNNISDSLEMNNIYSLPLLGTKSSSHNYQNMYYDIMNNLRMKKDNISENIFSDPKCEKKHIDKTAFYCAMKEYKSINSNPKTLERKVFDSFFNEFDSYFFTNTNGLHPYSLKKMKNRLIHFDMIKLYYEENKKTFDLSVTDYILWCMRKNEEIGSFSAVSIKEQKDASDREIYIQSYFQKASLYPMQKIMQGLCQTFEGELVSASEFKKYNDISSMTFNNTNIFINDDMKKWSPQDIKSKFGLVIDLLYLFNVIDPKYIKLLEKSYKATERIFLIFDKRLKDPTLTYYKPEFVSKHIKELTSGKQMCNCYQTKLDINEQGFHIVEMNNGWPQGLYHFMSSFTHGLTSKYIEKVIQKFNPKIQCEIFFHSDDKNSDFFSKDDDLTSYDTQFCVKANTFLVKKFSLDQSDTKPSVTLNPSQIISNELGLYLRLSELVSVYNIQGSIYNSYMRQCLTVTSGFVHMGFMDNHLSLMGRACQLFGLSNNILLPELMYSYYLDYLSSYYKYEPSEDKVINWGGSKSVSIFEIQKFGLRSDQLYKWLFGNRKMIKFQLENPITIKSSKDINTKNRKNFDANYSGFIFNQRKTSKLARVLESKFEDILSQGSGVFLNERSAVMNNFYRLRNLTIYKSWRRFNMSVNLKNLEKISEKLNPELDNYLKKGSFKLHEIDLNLDLELQNSDLDEAVFDNKSVQAHLFDLWSTIIKLEKMPDQDQPKGTVVRNKNSSSSDIKTDFSLIRKAALDPDGVCELLSNRDWNNLVSDFKAFTKSFKLNYYSELEGAKDLYEFYKKIVKTNSPIQMLFKSDSDFTDYKIIYAGKKINETVFDLASVSFKRKVLLEKPQVNRLITSFNSRVQNYLNKCVFDLHMREVNEKTCTTQLKKFLANTLAKFNEREIAKIASNFMFDVVSNLFRFSTNNLVPVSSDRLVNLINLVHEDKLIQSIVINGIETNRIIVESDSVRTEKPLKDEERELVKKRHRKLRIEEMSGHTELNTRFASYRFSPRDILDFEFKLVDNVVNLRFFTYGNGKQEVIDKIAEMRLNLSNLFESEKFELEKHLTKLYISSVLVRIEGPTCNCEFKTEPTKLNIFSEVPTLSVSDHIKEVEFVIESLKTIWKENFHLKIVEFGSVDNLSKGLIISGLSGEMNEGLYSYMQKTRRRLNFYENEQVEEFLSEKRHSEDLVIKSLNPISFGFSARQLKILYTMVNCLTASLEGTGRDLEVFLNLFFERSDFRLLLKLEILIKKSYTFIKNHNRVHIAQPEASKQDIMRQFLSIKNPDELKLKFIPISDKVQEIIDIMKSEPGLKSVFELIDEPFYSEVEIRLLKLISGEEKDQDTVSDEEVNTIIHKLRGLRLLQNSAISGNIDIYSKKKRQKLRLLRTIEKLNTYLRTAPYLMSRDDKLNDLIKNKIFLIDEKHKYIIFRDYKKSRTPLDKEFNHFYSRELPDEHMLKLEQYFREDEEKDASGLDYSTSFGDLFVDEALAGIDHETEGFDGAYRDIDLQDTVEEIDYAGVEIPNFDQEDGLKEFLEQFDGSYIMDYRQLSDIFRKYERLQDFHKEAITSKKTVFDDVSADFGLGRDSIGIHFKIRFLIWKQIQTEDETITESMRDWVLKGRYPLKRRKVLPIRYGETILINGFNSGDSSIIHKGNLRGIFVLNGLNDDENEIVSHLKWILNEALKSGKNVSNDLIQAVNIREELALNSGKINLKSFLNPVLSAETIWSSRMLEKLHNSLNLKYKRYIDDGKS